MARPWHATYCQIQHALTIGALGTLTVVMMLRVSARRRAPAAVVPRAIGLLSAAITLATLARLAAGLLDGDAHIMGLGPAAALWSISVLLFGDLYIRIAAARDRQAGV